MVYACNGKNFLDGGGGRNFLDGDGGGTSVDITMTLVETCSKI